MSEQDWLDKLLAQAPARTLIAGAALLGALLSLAGLLYLCKPAFGELRALRVELEGVSASLDAEQRAVDPAAVARLEASIAEKREMLYGASSVVDRREVEAQVIDVLDRSAVRHDVRLASVRPGKPGSVVMFDELPFDVEVSGAYFALFEWFRAAEHQLRPMIVKRFVIRDDKRGGSLNMELRLVAYRGKGDRI